MELLLVDDNETSLELQKYLLEDCGFSVETAASGEAAVRLAAQKDYSVILMDIQMPAMDGFTAASLIHGFQPSVPIFALSADEILPADPRYLAAGMCGALKKPLERNDILNTLSPFIEPGLREGRRHDTAEILFDCNELLRIMRDEKAVVQLLQQFLHLHAHDGDRLCACVREGDYRQARAIMHNILGVSGNMQCRRLYAVSVRLYEELKQETPQSLDAFLAVWKDTIRALSEQCALLSCKLRHTPTEAVWDTVWADFMGLCRDFDIAATDIFEKNAQVFSQNLRHDEYERLHSAIVHYDFLWIIENMEG